MITLISKNQNSVLKSVQWDATNNQGELVAAGLYLYNIKVGNHSKSKKLFF
ncbi:hypothetical protein N9N24_04870 [Candidatus Marinimicrobia bacterium]|nr:hypothetical protein [Candidatus Neomarinimicrobiota bacterium]